MSRERPNFLIIVADDLGFSDTGPFGSEINTPNLDRLIKLGGKQLTGFHTASACSPTRSMLLSGTDNHLAGLGQMAEFMKRTEGFEGHPGYEGVLNERVAALSEILEDAGYFTAMSGKWHLGLTKESSPWARGFQKSFALLPGAGNHFAYEPQDKDGSAAIKFMPPIYYADDQPVPLEHLPSPFYSSDVFAAKLIDFFDKRTHAERSKPFFAYLPFTAPHWPLQADPSVVKKYKGIYDDGPQVLRAQRLAALAKKGLIPTDVKSHPIVNSFNTSSWDELSADEKKYSSRLMETYAAMVEQMDTNIGNVLRSLEASGELEDTFVLFMSDNGAEGALLEALPVMGPYMSEVIEKYYDNSFDNIGRANSFTWYGPQWAQAGTAPSRMYKAWITEGGIRCPCIIKHPSFTISESILHEFSTVMDILPTILDMAKISHPGKHFRGRQILEPRGRSWLPYLSGSSDRIHSEEYVTGWELFGQQAIRQGRYKAIFIPAPNGPEKWQLYDISKDPGETADIANEEQETLKRLISHWATYVAETGTILIDPNSNGLASGYGPR